ncbi:hypothetical protein PROFUN_05178 [Planoprotostelium fungivorum]|uniref:Uncharacterized protein n=1 Tax=Planoprotostelium fungivorum TaxID=1890364 RepID=A0A2P6NRJ2_9EUKA|nr:hypothetical protein PROFUN_05178 [Planoprotostelium fungivorum]
MGQLHIHKHRGHKIQFQVDNSGKDNKNRWFFAYCAANTCQDSSYVKLATPVYHLIFNSHILMMGVRLTKKSEIQSHDAEKIDTTLYS